MHVPRGEGGRGMINLENCLKTATIGLNSYLESSDDGMLYIVLQYEKKKILHLVVKENRKFKFQLHIALEEHELNMTATKAAKEIKQNKISLSRKYEKHLDRETAVWKISTKD